MKYASISTEALNFGQQGIREMEEMLRHYEIRRVKVTDIPERFGQLITFEIVDRLTPVTKLQELQDKK